jgi:RNA polymerase sigma-70 factor (ECF subfamily)
MTDPEGERLLRRIADGDQDAMMTFYDAYFGVVAGLCRRMVADRDAADEVVQDVFWHVWRHAASFDGGRAGVATWLLVLARSRALDALRRRGRHGDDTQFWEDLPPTAVPAAPDDVPAAVEHNLAREHLYRAFAQLPDVQREVIGSVYFRGRSAREVADRQQVPVGTVKTRLRLGLEKLRRVMEAETDEA